MAPIRPAAPTPTPTPTPTRDHDFVSQPTPLDVLVTYLVPRVDSNDRSARFIHDADVYGSDPDSLTSSYDPAVAADGSQSWYFFTGLKEAKNGGSRKERRALDSVWSWHQDHRIPSLEYEGKQIGYYLALAYSRKAEENEGTRRIRSGWLMQEFRLLDRPDVNVALCRIYRTPRTRQASAPVAVPHSIQSAPPDPVAKPIQESAAAAALESFQSTPPAAITKPIQSARQESSAVPVPQSTQPAPPPAIAKTIQSAHQESSAVPVPQSTQPAPPPAIAKTIQSAHQESSAVTVPRSTQPAPPAAIAKTIQSARQESAAHVLESIRSAPPAVVAKPIQSVTHVSGTVEVCHPCDLDLINWFLVPRVNFKVIIHNASVYHSDPAQISSHFTPTVASDGQEAWYFFTDRYLEAGVRFVATGGYWESRYSAREILDDKREKVGEHQLFQFFKPDDNAQEGERDYVFTGWNMIELSTELEATVLCKLYRTSIGAPSRKRTRVDSVVTGCLGVKKPKEVAVAAVTMAI